jgi:thiol-disulfide isomerase/thioredoxin
MGCPSHQARHSDTHISLLPPPPHPPQNRRPLAHTPSSLPSLPFFPPPPVEAITLLRQMQAESPTIQTVAGNGRPTVVDFYAEWCENCKEMAPVLRAVEGKVSPAFPPSGLPSLPPFCPCCWKRKAGRRRFLLGRPFFSSSRHFLMSNFPLPPSFHTVQGPGEFCGHQRR